MPSSPLARAASRQEQQAATDKRIASEVAEAKARPTVVQPWKANQENFAPFNVLSAKYRLNLPYGTPYEAVFHPEAFSLFRQLQPGQRIEVWPADASYIAELVVIQRNDTRTKLHELWKRELPNVGPSGVDGVTGGYQSFHIGGGKWGVKRLEFTKPSGQVQPELIYKETFSSEFEAQTFIRLTLVGVRP